MTEEEVIMATTRHEHSSAYTAARLVNNFAHTFKEIIGKYNNIKTVVQLRFVDVYCRFWFPYWMYCGEARYARPGAVCVNEPNQPDANSCL